MRWSELFADLEARAVAWEAAELELEVADRTRAETGRVVLANRLRRQLGSSFRLEVHGLGAIEGVLDRVGGDWLLLGLAEDVVIPLAAITAVHDLPVAAVSPDGVNQVDSRLMLSSALRAIAVDRCVVRLHRRDGSTVVGTPSRVGADWVDLACHDGDEVPRAGTVRDVCTVPFYAVGAVRRLARGW